MTQTDHTGKQVEDGHSWVRSSELKDGDVISINPASSITHVLYREDDTHHSIQLTNRCNSYCLMCSQPPTDAADTWRGAEALSVVIHMRKSPASIGITGGEPLLEHSSLAVLIREIGERHPETQVDILTNGRLLASGPCLQNEGLFSHPKITWLVPLYGHVDYLHDFVVQRPGAFDQTIAGLLNLQQRHQPIQLRIVLIEPVLRFLPDLCTFIGRNLPFVREVALMACEPTGFALANREHCEVDLLDWAETISRSSEILHRHGVAQVYMNTPLCGLPRTLWPMAHKSISDWKNSYAMECEECLVKGSCCGLFSWHDKSWKPTKINPVRDLSL